MLPAIKKVPLQKEVFPQTWQTVIFRNYGLVANERLARTIGADEATLEIEAGRLGLTATYNPAWEGRGYITLIRNNWYLLPYSQLMTLLGYDEAKLEFVLTNEDFLRVKLGEMKPYCEEVFYSPLTEEEIAETERLAKEVKHYFTKELRPFDFFPEMEKETGQVRDYGEGIRLIHGYLTPCGDAFMEDGEGYLPDALLEKYQRLGVNGVWIHALLSSLSPYPFDETASKDYKIRRRNMQTLVNRAAKYGIKVYLYFNEPRGVAEEKLGKYAHWKGSISGGVAHLCFEQQEVREYLYSALKDLYTDVKGLGGAITITMSENPTHCNSHRNVNCPVCKNISAEKTAAAVNNVFAKALRDSGSGAKVLAYLWGWSPFMGWTKEQTERGINALDKEIIPVCASEYGLPLNKGGVPCEVIDYSISNPGPSPLTKFSFDRAQKRGMLACAKIQVNNSWECSATPYLPVFELVLQHLENLQNIGVKDYMLTWTLGGYPSPVLDMVASFASKQAEFSLDEWYQSRFGKDSEKVARASKLFCKGFQEYPFSIQSLYYAPKTLGPANLWSLQPEEKTSTMVCFAFDDYESWIAPYPYEVYVSQFKGLLFLWEKGLQSLKCVEGRAAKEVAQCAEVAYIHFKSDLLQTQFSYYKREREKNKRVLERILDEERSLTERLLILAAQNPAVGFEASNHYFYNERNLIEKILQTNILKYELLTEDLK